MSNNRRKRQPAQKPSALRPAGATSTGTAPTSSSGLDGLKQGGSDITVFLSYARTDDAAFDMIKPFKDLLQTFVYLKSGRKISSFLDQENILWGQIWRERLNQEIRSAAVFIPLLSTSYLDSTACRMEYNKFQSAAEAAGVPELLLPVLVVNAPLVFNENSPDDLVRSAVEHQYELIEEAVLSDRRSAEWKQTMSRLADRFTESYQAAESKLASLDNALARAEISELEDDESELDEPGLTEVMESFQEHLQTMTAAVNDLNPAIESLGTAAGSVGELRDQPTPKETQIWALRAAKAFEAPSLELSDAGERLFAATKDLDGVVGRLRQIANDLADLGFDEVYRQTMSGFSGLESVRSQMIALLDSMKPAEYMSIPIRKSLRPARRGLTRVTDSIQIIGTWPSLGSDGS